MSFYFQKLLFAIFQNEFRQYVNDESQNPFPSVSLGFDQRI